MGNSKMKLLTLGLFFPICFTSWSMEPKSIKYSTTAEELTDTQRVEFVEIFKYFPNSPSPELLTKFKAKISEIEYLEALIPKVRAGSQLHEAIVAAQKATASDNPSIQCAAAKLFAVLVQSNIACEEAQLAATILMSSSANIVKEAGIYLLKELSRVNRED